LRISLKLRTDINVVNTSDTGMLPMLINKDKHKTTLIARRTQINRTIFQLLHQCYCTVLPDKIHSHQVGILAIIQPDKKEFLLSKEIADLPADLFVRQWQCMNTRQEEYPIIRIGIYRPGKGSVVLPCT
jgi:hypothetical protein